MIDLKNLIVRLENLQVCYNQKTGEYFEGMSDAYEEIIEMIENEMDGEL